MKTRSPVISLLKVIYIISIRALPQQRGDYLHEIFSVPVFLKSRDSETSLEARLRTMNFSELLLLLLVLPNLVAHANRFSKPSASDQLLELDVYVSTKNGTDVPTCGSL